jgi:hypothetical protein
MTQEKKFKNCYLLDISGETTTILDVSIDQFINETVVPMLFSLMNSNEKMMIHIGKVPCTDLDGSPHKCIAKIKMLKIDNEDEKK